MTDKDKKKEIERKDGGHHTTDGDRTRNDSVRKIEKPWPPENTDNFKGIRPKKPQK